MTAIGLLLTVLCSPLPPAQAAGASLSFTPNQGQYFVDSTFEVSILVNTGGNSINAVETLVTFPADKLQVVNPTVSKSFIEIWASGPSYSNTNGTISFSGGLPSPGISTSAGVVSTIQFRAKSAGKATLKFSDDSKVLANDGAGTNLLTSKGQATYTIQLPAPAGPRVSSPTHEDQNKWYSNRTVTMNWESAGSDYSYLFDTSPATTPPETSKTTETQVTETMTGDGIWYFHIRAKNGTGWGGTTHYSLKIDGSPPASFKPQLDRSSWAVGTRALTRFTTTDSTSGLSHYEVRVIDSNADGDTTAFFTEQQSPYQLPDLPAGQYKLVVRAYDHAGNTADGIVDFSVGGLTPGGGLLSATNLVITALSGLILCFLIFWWRRRRHERRVGRLHDDLASLKQTVSERQAELQKLQVLQTDSASEIAALTPPVNLQPDPPPAPTIETRAELPNPPSTSPPSSFPPASGMIN